MLAFRSEAHVERWSRARRLPRGAVFTLAQAWLLAAAWYGDRLSADWRRRTAAQAEATFAGIGLTGPFWSLTD
jgi:hypothetical protein